MQFDVDGALGVGVAEILPDLHERRRLSRAQLILRSCSDIAPVSKDTVGVPDGGRLDQQVQIRDSGQPLRQVLVALEVAIDDACIIERLE